MSAYTLPGIVPNPYLPFSDYHVPKTITNTTMQQVVQFPSGGPVHYHFAIVYSLSDKVPTSSSITMGGVYGQSKYSATAIGPFDWQKVSDGGYYAFVQFNLDTPTDFHGQSATIQELGGDDGSTFTLMVDGEVGKENETFRVFHGVPSHAPPPGSAPSRPATANSCNNLNPKTTYTLPLSKSYVLNSLTLYVNILANIPQFQNFVTVANVKPDSAVYQTLPSSDPSGCGASLQLRFSKGVPVKPGSQVVVSSQVAGAGVAFNNDTAGLFFTSTAASGMAAGGGFSPAATPCSAGQCRGPDGACGECCKSGFCRAGTKCIKCASSYPRPQGPVTKDCPTCFDPPCPLSDMITGNCATTRKETTDTNAVFYNKCTYGSTTEPCWPSFSGDTVGIYTQPPNKVLEAAQGGASSGSSINYYLPQALVDANNNPLNVYTATRKCVDSNCTSEEHHCADYTADGSSFSPFCPKMTSPVVASCNGINGSITRSIQCVYNDPPACSSSNGYSTYRNTCAMHPPTNTPISSSSDVCSHVWTTHGKGEPTVTCSGDIDDSMLTDGWTAATCSGVGSAISPPDCKVTFTNKSAKPKEGYFYWKSGTVGNFITPVDAVECTKPNGCTDVLKSVTLDSSGWS